MNERIAGESFDFRRLSGTSLNLIRCSIVPTGTTDFLVRSVASAARSTLHMSLGVYLSRSRQGYLFPR
jgi:hypothetical protein